MENLKEKIDEALASAEGSLTETTESQVIDGTLEVEGNVTAKKNLRVEGFLDAPNIRGCSKGLYRTREQLLAKYPRPHEGWWAVVANWEKMEAEVGDGEGTETTSVITYDSVLYIVQLDEYQRPYWYNTGKVVALDGLINQFGDIDNMWAAIKEMNEKYTTWLETLDTWVQEAYDEVRADLITTAEGGTGKVIVGGEEITTDTLKVETEIQSPPIGHEADGKNLEVDVTLDLSGTRSLLITSAEGATGKVIVGGEEITTDTLKVETEIQSPPIGHEADGKNLEVDVTLDLSGTRSLLITSAEGATGKVIVDGAEVKNDTLTVANAIQSPPVGKETNGKNLETDVTLDLSGTRALIKTAQDGVDDLNKLLEDYTEEKAKWDNVSRQIKSGRINNGTERFDGVICSDLDKSDEDYVAVEIYNDISGDPAEPTTYDGVIWLCVERMFVAYNTYLVTPDDGSRPYVLYRCYKHWDMDYEYMESPGVENGLWKDKIYLGEGHLWYWMRCNGTLCLASGSGDIELVSYEEIDEELAKFQFVEPTAAGVGSISVEAEEPLVGEASAPDETGNVKIKLTITEVTTEEINNITGKEE